MIVLAIPDWFFPDWHPVARRAGWLLTFVGAIFILVAPFYFL